MNNKSLTEVVADFQSKVNARGQKIREAIASREAEAKRIRTQIESETQKIIELELAGDTKAPDSLKEELRNLRLQLEDVRGFAAVYASELDRVGAHPDEIAGIRAAAARERDARLQRLKALTEERKSLKAQIEALERKLDQVDTEICRSQAQIEARQLLPVAALLDPRIKVLPGYEWEHYLIRWLENNEEGIQQILAQHAPREESQRVTHLGQPEKVVHEGPEEPQAEPRCLRKTRHIIGSGVTEVETEGRSYTVSS